MKKYIYGYLICAMLLMFGNYTNLSAQTSIEENNVVRADLNMMFARLLVQEKPITGLLRDYAVDLVDLDDYDGTKLNDSTFVNRIIFEDILRTINSSSVLEEKPIEALPICLRYLEETDTPSEVRLGVALYDYNYIPANAVETNRIRCVGGIVLKGGTASPYEFNQVFAMTVGSDVCKSMSVDYNFYGDNLYTNIADAAYLFDAGDGNGWRTMDPNSGMRITYTEEGEKELKMLALLQDGRELISHSKIYIINPNTNSELGAAEPCKLPGYERYITYNDDVKVEALVSYRCKSADGKIRKPFIIVEGFDPYILADIFGGNLYLADPDEPMRGFTSYNTFLTKINNGIEACVNTLIDNIELFNDYDFIYIDWYNSTEDIRANAQLLINIIEEINANKIGTEGGILVGQSMGGLVARYALKSMENEGKLHGITTFVSHDTPHLGANVPLGVQYLIQQFICMLKGQIGLVNIEDLVGRFVGNEMEEKISALLDILHSPAAQQMMCNYVNKSGVLDNTIHDDWMEELDALGFPEGAPCCKMELLSIVNGRQYDYSQMLAANQHLLLIDGYAKTSALTDWILSMLSVVFYGVFHVPVDSLIDLPISWLGSNRLNIHAEANPLVSANVGQTLSALSLVYKKRFLWLFPKTYSLFNSNITIPYSSLFYDEYPGSTYAAMLSEISDQINEMCSNFEGSGWWGEYNLDMAITKGITFIPTASALCIKNGESVAHADYMRDYYTDPPTPKDEVPFDAYYLWDMASEHIDCNAEVLDWINEQSNMTMNGVDLITYDGVSDINAMGGVYYIVGSNANFDWYSSDPTVATIDNTGKLTVHKEGTTTITAESYANGRLLRKSKEVTIQEYPDIVISKSFEVGVGYKFTVELTDPTDAENINQLLNYGLVKYEWSIIDSNGERTTTETNRNSITYLPKDDEAVTVVVRFTDKVNSKSYFRSTSFNLQTPFSLNYEYIVIDGYGIANYVKSDGTYEPTSPTSQFAITFRKLYLDSTDNMATMVNKYIKGDTCYLKYYDNVYGECYMTGTKSGLFSTWSFNLFSSAPFLSLMSDVINLAVGEPRILGVLNMTICNTEYEELQRVPLTVIYNPQFGQN